jgi:hypothetical protein
MRRIAGGIILVMVLLLGALSFGQKANSPVAEKKSYIEVHGPDIAFVPMTEIYVKYDGKIKKIVRFAATQGNGKEDCKCPKCCDGICYVIIYTDVVLPGGPARVLYFLWVDC